MRKSVSHSHNAIRLVMAMALAVVAVLAPGPTLAQPQEQKGQVSQEKGTFDEPYLWGLFDETTTDAKNSWFYDSYSYDPSLKDWTEIPWYSQPPAYSGVFNDNLTDNDWFFDAYAPSSSSDLFLQR